MEVTVAVGWGAAGSTFWPRLTCPTWRPGELLGPVPPATPRLTPRTACVPLPVRDWPPGLPEPRLTAVARGPPPVFEAGMPAMPRWPRLTALVAGLLEG